METAALRAWWLLSCVALCTRQQRCCHLWPAGNGDSSPSRHDKGTKPATAAQQAADAAAEMAEAVGDGAEEAATEPAATTSGSLAAITPQRSSAADDSVQTPKRAVSASALSVFMTPSRSGTHLPLCASVHKCSAA